MLLPDGKRTAARLSETRALTTLDPILNQQLLLDHDAFANATGLLRGTVTHDGLPFNLGVEIQPLIYAVILTRWRMELDRRGALTSYVVHTQHARLQIPCGL